MDDDGRFVQRYLEGDIGAFDELVHRHSSSVFTFILRRVPDRSSAEDVLQDVFIRMLTHLHEYRHRGRMRSWLFRIAHNRIVDEARQRRSAGLISTETRHPAAEDTGPTLGDRLSAPAQQQPEQLAERRELAAAAEGALGLLAPAQRDVFLMRQAGLAFKEIARIQGCSINTALGRMHDAVRALRRRLGT